MRAWYFEKCCQLQMDVLKSSRPYRVLSTEQLESSKASLDAEFPPGVHEWPAVLRWRSQLCPEAPGRLCSRAFAIWIALFQGDRLALRAARCGVSRRLGAQARRRPLPR